MKPTYTILSKRQVEQMLANWKAEDEPSKTKSFHGLISRPKFDLDGRKQVNIYTYAEQ